MNNKVKFKGPMKHFMRWPLYLSVLVVLLDLLVFIVSVKAGILVSVGTVIYIFIAVQLFRYHKPLIINDMIAFANQYDVVEKRMLEELAQKIQSENWFDFDVVIASPDMMGVVGRIGRVLGPKGLMPNPKAGTVTPDVAKAVEEAKAGKIEYRLDKANIIHCPIGKASFGPEKLGANFNVLMGAIIKAKPSAAKGTYLKSVTIASTMGPGVKIAANKLEN